MTKMKSRKQGEHNTVYDEFFCSGILWIVKLGTSVDSNYVKPTQFRWDIERGRVRPLGSL